MSDRGVMGGGWVVFGSLHSELHGGLHGGLRGDGVD